MNMRKFSFVLLATLFLTAANVHAVGLGVPFGFGSSTIFNESSTGSGSVGLRIHFSDMFALQPALAFHSESGDFSNKETTMMLSVAGFFYLLETNDIRHYVGANINMSTADNSPFGLSVVYGLQHQVLDAVDLFGQVGFGMLFDDNRSRNDFSTLNTQIGVIFYFSR